MGFVNKIIGSITGANQAADAAKGAAQTQANAAQAGINQQNQMFAALQQALSPYTQAGTGALGAYQSLSGLGGQAAQQTAIDGIQNGAQFQALNQQGQNAILQNASATGGLRGGNTQAALAQFSPQLLQGLIQQSLGNYGNIASLGQSSAAGVGNAGMQSANSISGLLQQQGAATAGGQVAAGQSGINNFGTLLNAGGLLAGSGALKGLFGGGTTAMNTFNVSPGTLPTSSLLGDLGKGIFSF